MAGRPVENTSETSVGAFLEHYRGADGPGAGVLDRPSGDPRALNGGVCVLERSSDPGEKKGKNQNKKMMRKGRESKFSHRLLLVSKQKKAVLLLRGVSVFSNKRMRGALPATDPSLCLTAAVDLLP